ncbi:hypothetical protein [Helicobacter sp. 23-1045]
MKINKISLNRRISHKNAESAPTSSLRGSGEAQALQSIRFAMPNLAMANFAYQRHKLKNG